MNGDGWDDILTWDYYNHVLVHRNNAAGGFVTVVNVNADEDPRNCIAFDFDNDEDLDILVSDWHTGISVYRNNGVLSYTKMFNKATSNDYAGVAAIDLLLDGKTGIFFGTNGSYYRNWGNFSFLTWQHYAFEANYKQLWFADIDHTGLAELIGYGTGGLFVHRESQFTIDYDGDGYFTDVDCNDFDTLVNPGVLEVPNNQVDENCDGILDFIDVDGDGYNADVDCNDGDEDIHPDAVEIPGNGTDENCDGLDVFGDADGDGYAWDMDCNDEDPDISPGAYDVPQNNIDEDCDGVDDPSYFVDRRRLYFDYPVVDVDAADFNGDGRLEVLYTSHQLIGWIGYDVPGGPPSGFVSIDNAAAFTHAEPGDFDGDGDMDVVGASDTWNTITLFRNDGHGEFDEGVALDTFASVLAMDIGDIDADGHLDVAVTLYGGSSHKPSIYFGDGEGGFTEIKPVTENANLFPRIYVYDVDGDVDLDLFISTSALGMGWYENLGNRLFSARKSICDECKYADDLFHVDYDKDGIKELVYYISGAGTNPGIKAFVCTGDSIVYDDILIQHDVLGRIYPQDMNGDCTVDFVWGGINYLTMGIAYNFGETPFPEHRMRDTSLRIQDIIAEDLNEDGNPEIIFGTANQNTMTIIRNEFPAQDVDGDGADQLTDCAYCDPAIFPGAIEIPENGIDENCDGLDMITAVDQSTWRTIKCYPNPTDGIIYLDLEYPTSYVISVYNNLGHLVAREDNVSVIDLSNRPSGVYMLIMEGTHSGVRWMGRIVVQ
jgi:hypothetical protein